MKGPNGEWRPADVIANAVHVGRIATREIEDERQPRRQRQKRAQVPKDDAAARWEAINRGP